MIKYSYVSLENQWMKLGYKLAKNLYLVRKFNKKAIPVSIIVKDGKYIAHGVCSNGLHAIEGICNRLGEKGSDYSSCVYCAEDQHSEKLALIDAGSTELQNAKLYLYGYYKLCDSCTEALEARGITECVFLENAEILFDRHNPDTVLGTENQFQL